MRGQVRGSRDLSVLAARCHTSGRANKQIWPPGKVGSAGVAPPGQVAAQDRTGSGGRPLIDAGHYFQPRKLGQSRTERCHGNWGGAVKGSRAEGFLSGFSPAAFVKSAMLADANVNTL